MQKIGKPIKIRRIMKAKYLYLAMMSLALSFGFTACSSDDDDQPAPTPTTKSEIAFDTDTVKVGVGESATFNITAGGGDYKIINENPDIASGTLAGTAVTVISVKKGITGLVISDAQGNYKRIMVKSMYFKMTLDKEAVEIGMKLGHTDGTAKVTVTGGNGNYTAVSADTKIAKIGSIRDSVITLNGVAEGTTTVTITDMMGLTKTVNVTVKTTTIPYTEDEKKNMMAANSNVITWDDNTSHNWGTFATQVEDGQQEAYWDYYGYYYIKVYFDGDLTVGKKTNGKVAVKFSWGDDAAVTYSPVDIEVIKNDGTHVWGIMSMVKDNYLHYGHFCVEL
jgi:hypothetical protein